MVSHRVTTAAEGLSYAHHLKTIYFVYQNGCVACEAATPELDAFLRRHPDVLSVRLEVNGIVTARLEVAVRATPTYILKRGDGAMKIHAGALTAKEIEKWIGGETPERRRRASTAVRGAR
jgi:hypothetical protein